LEDRKLILRSTHSFEYNDGKGRRYGVFLEKIYEGIELDHWGVGS